MQTAHVHHQHTANFSTCALCQNWRHWFSTLLCVKLAHFFSCAIIKMHAYYVEKQPTSLARGKNNTSNEGRVHTACR